ncbi:uncharacterized protein LOC141686178 [Apium graveolens]|uniref:uncharacterized protein LOC141686178 n=1 Tax=Apium graveolens TaxID=4045 RepID=UPI003D78D62C
MSTWSKPAVGTVKVNVKGSFLRSHMRASVACIMRDSNGNWMKGCKSMIGLAVPMTAEQWSIWYGLKMVNNPDEDYDMFDLVLMIRKIMYEKWDFCDVVHIPSTSNAPVAALANEAINDHGGLEDVIVPPSSIQGLLLADKMA